MVLNQDQPLATIILFAYNQEDLVVEAVESLLAQTYSPLEIILSDDCSSDDTFNRMKSLVDGYSGPHRIKLNRNKSNLGMIAHVNAATAMAEGELVFAAAGDDVSLPDRCEKVVSAWLVNNKQVDLIATDGFDMAFEGDILGVKLTDNLQDWLSIKDWFIRSPYIFGASHTWSRNLINRFGMIDSKNKQEDQVMTFRAILIGSAIRVPEPLVKHRRGGVSQQEKSIDVYEKRQEMRAGNLNNLVFIQQCILDAKVVDQEKIVEDGFENKINYGRMIEALFQSNSAFKAIKIVFITQKVSIAKKIRFLIYASFPWILKPYFSMKRIFKKLNYERVR